MKLDMKTLASDLVTAVKQHVGMRLEPHDARIRDLEARLAALEARVAEAEAKALTLRRVA